MKKNKNKNNENILADEVYDGFEYFANDGRDQSRYKYFRQSAVVNPQPDEYAIVINTWNSKRENVELLGPGFHFLGAKALYKKFIYVPNPDGAVKIDFKPKKGDENDKKENFMFTPGVVSDDKDASKDEIYIDYIVEVKWVDPVKYFYTPRVIPILQSTIVGVIRSYVSQHTKADVFKWKGKGVDLEEIDKNGELKEFKEKYGLKVVALNVNNVIQSDAVQKAMNETEVAREGKKKAEYEAESIRIKSNAEREMFSGILQEGAKNGLNSDQKVSLVESFAAYKASQNPNAHIFYGFGNRSGSQIDPMMLYADLKSRGNSITDENKQIIDAEYSELYEVEDKEKGRKR